MSSVEQQLKEIRLKQRELELSLHEKRRFDFAKRFLEKHPFKIEKKDGKFVYTRIYAEDIAKSSDTDVAYDEHGFPVLGFDYGNGGVSWLMVSDRTTGPEDYREYELLNDARHAFSYKNYRTPAEARKAMTDMMNRIKKEWRK